MSGGDEAKRRDRANARIAERLSDAMSGKNATEWARVLGVTDATILRYWDGSRRPNPARLAQLLRAIRDHFPPGVSADWILGVPGSRRDLPAFSDPAAAALEAIARRPPASVLAESIGWVVMRSINRAIAESDLDALKHELGRRYPNGGLTLLLELGQHWPTDPEADTDDDG